MSKTYDIAAYVWPSYTGKEPRAKIFWPEGYGEWQSVQNSVPKENGYNWGRRSLWGYPDEAEPAVMEFEINEALRHGVNVFAYDWYWFDRRPFLEQCLNDGFLKASNNKQMKFYLMWANHDANYTWDIRISEDQDTVLWRGDVDRPEFERVAQRLIKTYFKLPNYYTINGKPLFCIYCLYNILKGLGGPEQTRDAFIWFREECIRQDLPGLHLQTILQSPHVENHSGVDTNVMNYTPALINYLCIDSVTHYNFNAFIDIDQDYLSVLEDVVQQWKKLDRAYSVPYFPNISLGWDNNPRFIRFRRGILHGTTPENIRRGFDMAKKYVDAHPQQPPLVTVNSWNEWTETSYLQPDNVNGYGYLEAIKNTFL